MYNQLTINSTTVLVPKGSTILEACRFVGVDIPRFCYADNLSVAGNCRMCLVEVRGMPKPVAACAMPVSDGLTIYTDSPAVKKARENVLETLLLNHPLDCPICDQGGECDLQDQTKHFGSDSSRYYKVKRSVVDKYTGPLIKTIMTRCIHCTRCVRYAAEIAGIDVLGTLNRGGSTEIGAYIDRILNSEISGNLIDLCPVGALTSKPYAFTARPWELRTAESFDFTDSIGSSIFIDFKESEVVRITPRNDEYSGNEWIGDRIRFSYDALRRQRLCTILQKDSVSGRFQSKDWVQCLDTLKANFKNKKVLLALGSGVDNQSLALLKSFTSVGNIRTRSIESATARSTNWLQSATLSATRKADLIFTIGTNPRFEGAVLNIRLRMAYVRGNIDFVGFGAPFKDNTGMNFIGLTLKELIAIFEGRSKTLSTLCNATKPLIITGESLHKRFSVNLCTKKLHNLHKNSMSLVLHKKINTQTTIFENIRPLKNQDLVWCDILFTLFADDSQKLRLIFKKLQSKQTITGSSHGNLCTTYNDLILPLAHLTEVDSTFTNFESRILKGEKVFKQHNSVRSLSLLATVLGGKAKTTQPFDLSGSQWFTYSEGSKVYSQSVISSQNNAELLSNYPLKSSLEDYYCVDSFTRNSQIMGTTSSISRANSSNFF
jgi:NADH-quinone oxidoreductase chain G